jgi:hypothetical protein
VPEAHAPDLPSRQMIADATFGQGPDNSSHNLLSFKDAYYREIRGALEGLMAMTPNSHTSAHSVTTTVAPFRAWRGSWLAVARGPKGATIK